MENIDVKTQELFDFFGKLRDSLSADSEFFIRPNNVLAINKCLSYFTFVVDKFAIGLCDEDDVITLPGLFDDFYDNVVKSILSGNSIAKSYNLALIETFELLCNN